jgi:hypothetical protein
VKSHTNHGYALLSMAVLIASLVSACAAPPPVMGPDGGKIIFQDDFKDPKSGWFVYGADASMSGKYGVGSYDVQAVDRKQIIVLNPRLKQQQGDYEVEATVKKTSGPVGALLGIVYRFGDNGYYYRFSITDNRTWVVGRKSAAVFEEMMMELQSSDFIRPGDEANSLKVVCRGENQDFYVNGNKLGSISDNTSLKGDVGMIFSNWTTNAGYSFSDFRLTSLKQ